MNLPVRTPTSGTEIADRDGASRVSFNTNMGIFASPERFEFAQRAARAFAESDLVPKHFQGKLSNCMLALNIAERMGEEPLHVFQNLIVIHGRPGWMTQYMIARANMSGIFRGRISWKSEGAGEKLVVQAYAKLADTGETVSAETSMAMAKAEGWTKNDKYRSMPEHMLRFRAAAMLIRLYAPEVMLGYQTAEELEDIRAATARDTTPPRSAPPQEAGPPRQIRGDRFHGTDDDFADQSAPAEEAEAQVDEATFDAKQAIEDFEQHALLARAVEEIDEMIDTLREAGQLTREQEARVEAIYEQATARLAKAGQADQAEAGEAPAGKEGNGSGPPRQAAQAGPPRQADKAPDSDAGAGSDLDQAREAAMRGSMALNRFLNKLPLDAFSQDEIKSLKQAAKNVDEAEYRA